MTDRTRHLTIVLENDMRVDDAQDLIDSFRMNRYVADVLIGEPPDYMARIQAISELKKELRDWMLNTLFDFKRKA